MTDSAQIEFLKDVLASYREEYKELADIFKQLDIKAQGTVTVAGIFLAGVFTFSKEPTITAHLYDQVFIVLTAVLLALSIVAALMSLTIRRMLFPPFGETHDRLVTDWLDGGIGFEDEQRITYFKHQNAGWKAASAVLHTVNGHKADAVWAAQWILLGAAACATILTVLATVIPR